MNKIGLYLTAIGFSLAVGAAYFSKEAEADTNLGHTSALSSSLRFAADALTERGFAVLCGDSLSNSSQDNINALIVNLGSYYREPFSARPFESASSVCLFLSR